LLYACFNFASHTNLFNEFAINNDVFFSHPTLLHHHFSHHLKQPNPGIPERSEGGANFPNYENHENPQTSPAFHRTAVLGFHIEEELQRAGFADAVPCYRNNDVLEVDIGLSAIEPD